MATLLATLGLRGAEASAVADPISFVIVGAYFWMLLASHAKRWHDLGHSGWWQLVALIPFGPIYVLVMCGFARGDTGPNHYVPDPLSDRDTRKYSDLISQDPENALARIARGTALALGIQYDRAMEDFNAAIALNPKEDPEAFNGRYDRAVAVNPQNAETLFGRGVLKLRMANKDGEHDIPKAKVIDRKIAKRMSFLSISV